MQQGKHTEYEKKLHEEMLLNSTANVTTTNSSESPPLNTIPNNENNRTSSSSNHQTTDKSQNNGGGRNLNSTSPVTVIGGDNIGGLQQLDSGGTKTGADKNKTHHSGNKSTNSGNGKNTNSTSAISGGNSGTNLVNSSRTPSPKVGGQQPQQNGHHVVDHHSRVGGVGSCGNSGLNGTCGSVGSTTSSGSQGSTSSGSVSGLGSSSALGMWPNLDRSAVNSGRKWNDSPDSLR